MNQPHPIAIYARTSVAEGHPEAQLHRLQAYAIARGTPAIEYVDEAVSGARRSRPALDRLLASARRREVIAVVYTSRITISGIPLGAHEYRLGSRSASDWVLNQYQVSTQKASAFMNDPNDWSSEHDDPTYIFDLLRRVVTVSMRTLDIVESLPSLNLSRPD